MKGEDLLRAMGDVDDSFAAEARGKAVKSSDAKAEDGRKDSGTAVRVSGGAERAGGSGYMSRRTAVSVSFAAACAAAVISVGALHMMDRRAAPAGNNTGAESGESEEPETALSAGNAAVPSGSGSGENESGERPDSGSADSGGGETDFRFTFSEDDYTSTELVNCASLEAAETLAGFEISIPDTIGSYEQAKYRCVAGSLLEIIYTDTGGNETVRIRKAPGSHELSGLEGDEYEIDEIDVIGELQVYMRGTSDGIDGATWETGGFSYAINTDGTALTKEEMQDLIPDIN